MGLNRCHRGICHNRVAVVIFLRRIPKVARPSQPWAGGHNPFGIARPFPIAAGENTGTAASGDKGCPFGRGTSSVGVPGCAGAHNRTKVLMRVEHQTTYLKITSAGVERRYQTLEASLEAGIFLPCQSTNFIVRIAERTARCSSVPRIGKARLARIAVRSDCPRSSRSLLRAAGVMKHRRRARAFLGRAVGAAPARRTRIEGIRR